MSDSKIERREHPRVLMRALVDYESQDTFLYDYSRDLSEGGLFIQTDKPLAIGEVITLKFTLPNVDKVFEIAGIVRWTNPDSVEGLLKGMGVEFKDVCESDKKLIEDYVKEMDKE